MRRLTLHRSGNRPTYCARRRAAGAAASVDPEDIIMWGFVADTTAAHLCRGYDAALGHFPAACQSNSGLPALAITGIVLLAAFVCGRMALSRWNRAH
jgi:hypothetical protein